MATSERGPLRADERLPVTLPLPNWVAYAIAGVSVASTVMLPFALASGDLSLTEAVGGYYLLSAALFAVLGALILWRRPGHAVGWILVGIGGCDTVTRLVDEYELFRLADRAGFPALATVELASWTWVPLIAGIMIWLPLLFPDGRLLSRRWRPLAWFGAVATTLLSLTFLIDADGYEPLAGVGFAVFLAATLASSVPFVLRFRRSRGVERQQFKWVFYGLAVSIPMLVVGTSGTWLGALTAVWSIPPMVILPVFIAVAVLKYRLYDVDVVISRTLLVAGLVGFITVAYVGIVVGVGSLLGRGGGEPNLVLSVVATTVVAVLFQPVRVWLQGVANRLVFGRRSTPYDVLSGFATRVGAGEASPESLVHLAELVAGGTGADPARVWLRVGSQLRAEASWPVDPDAGDDAVAIDVEGDVESAVGRLPGADLSVPVVERGELLGVLTIAKPRGERVSEVDVDLVERLAAASGVVLRNLRLDAELGQRLDDLEASRRRLVSAQDDARRRIEADLAGGSRAELGLLREKLTELAGQVDAVAAPKTAMLLTQLVGATDGALGTLAGLAAGVYPPRLAADGLVVALTEQGSKAALPVRVHADGVGRYAPEVEAAVYFAVLEGLQNVAKYANATTAHVRLRDDGGGLSFEVTDDGAGFDTASTTLGTGLQGITDRLDTVGGTLTITSTPGTGTTITGHTPTPSATAAPELIPELAGATP
ncbi:MAG: ATP-binding protein [Aeromicrobium sp.]